MFQYFIVFTTLFCIVCNIIIYLYFLGIFHFCFSIILGIALYYFNFVMDPKQIGENSKNIILLYRFKWTVLIVWLIYKMTILLVLCSYFHNCVYFGEGEGDKCLTEKLHLYCGWKPSSLSKNLNISYIKWLRKQSCTEHKIRNLLIIYPLI